MQLTPRAHRAIEFSVTQVRELQHPCVCSHHLLIGLVLLGSGIPVHLLERLGLTLPVLREVVSGLGPVEEPTEVIENLTLGRSAAAALRRAAHGAELLSHTYTGTEHILMALLSERSAGSARIFALRSVDTITARRMLMRECAWTLSEEPDHESA